MSVTTLLRTRAEAEETCAWLASCGWAALRQSPPALVKLLNTYFSEMTAAIHAHNVIIDKFVGDGLMAFWTAPFSRGESHATDACLAALAQQRAIRELREHLSDVLGLRRDLPEFSVRMGLATGDLVVGTIGSTEARSFTVIGDTVNLASRLAMLA